MIKSKKGDMNILFAFMIILIFGISSIITVIMGYLLFAIGNDYVVLPLYNISQNMNQTDQLNAAFAGVVQNYQGLDLGFIDDMWFTAYMVLIISSVVGAYRSRKLNNFTFLSMVTYGMMFMLYIAGFFFVIVNWLYSDILLNLFVNLTPSVPKLEWFVSNYGFQFLLHASLLLLIKVVDLDFSTIRNREQKEMAAFDDEIL